MDVQPVVDYTIYQLEGGQRVSEERSQVSTDTQGFTTLDCAAGSLAALTWKALVWGATLYFFGMERTVHAGHALSEYQHFSRHVYKGTC